MDTINCRICGYAVKKLFTAEILNKYNVKYFFCQNCGFIQTEKPYWLAKTYSNAISDFDTGILSRNLNFSKKLTIILFYLLGINATKYNYLDYGGGYGILVRLMRDIGFNFYWQDKYAKNLFSKGFEYKKQDVKAITCFEVFEHLLNPEEVINYFLNELNCKTIIFSTVLCGENPPSPENWWYYAFQEGQHISFYNLKTLKYLAKKYNLNLLTYGQSIHVLTNIKKSNFVFKILNKFSDIIYPGIKIFKSKTWEDHRGKMNKTK